MKALSWLLVLGGAVLNCELARADSLTDYYLIDRTQPGFHYPGPFNSPQNFIIYQRPAGSLVWNGHWYVYQEPYAEQRVLRRAN